MKRLQVIVCFLVVCSFISAVAASAQQPYATHDIGNCMYTVTYYGASGFMNSDRLDGDGFKYPSPYANQWFYYGGMAAGNSSAYVCDRFYGVGAPGPDNTDWENQAGLTFGGTANSDQDGWAQYDDSGHPSAVGLLVTQDSWAWADPGYEDFVIVKYTFENLSYDSITNFYAGQFIDFDMNDISPNPYNNWAGVDATRNLAYMWSDAFPTTHVGLKLLDPLMAANVSIIHNPTYVWPATEMTDATKFNFLDGTYSFSTASNDTDWSVMVSAGPFTLGPGETVEVAIAVLGGDDLADIQANADSAQSIYETAVEEVRHRDEVKSYQLSQSYPNPFTRTTTISYHIPVAGRADLRVYDVTGRLVRTLVDGVEEPGRYEVAWDGKDSSGRDVATGVYLYRLQAGEFTCTRKLTVLR